MADSSSSFALLLIFQISLVTAILRETSTQMPAVLLPLEKSSDKPVKSTRVTSSGVIGRSTDHVGQYDQHANLSQKAGINNSMLRPIRVVTVLHTPYVMQGPQETLVGLVPDILHHLQMHLHVTFDLHLVPDGKYGSCDRNGSWDGMMRELVNWRKGDSSGAEIAAAPVLMTGERQKAVSFLHPFKHGGLVGLMRKPHLDNHTRHLADSIYVNVIRPLGTDVWLCIITACLAVASGLWLINRFDPYEWTGRYHIGRATKAASESFNFPGSLWFAFTTLHWQGFDRMPRSIAAKVLSGFWFCFVTLAITTYTASLINHLFWASTKQGYLTKPPFIDLAHLATAHDDLGYDYGVEVTGPAFTFLMQKAMGHEYNLMRKYWSNEGVKNLVVDTFHGLSRAREGKYVFITERMTAEFFVNQRPCDLMMIDKPIARSSYGMAISKNMDKPLWQAIQLVLAEMAEAGQIDILEQHWFNDMGQCWNETRKEKAKSEVSTLFLEEPKQITIAMFWGPLLILFIGVLFSILLFMGEVFFYRYTQKHSRANRHGGHHLEATNGEFVD